MVKKKEHKKTESKAQKFREEKLAEKKKKTVMFWLTGIIVVGLIFATMLSLSPKEIDQSNLVFGDDQITMTYFHLTTCPHCIKQNAYNKYLIAKYPNLKIEEFEITKPGSLEKYKQVAAQIEGLEVDRFPGTPLTVFMQSGKFNVGYGTDETTGKKLVEMIDEVQADIDSNWDVSTMKRTAELRGSSE